MLYRRSRLMLGAQTTGDQSAALIAPGYASPPSDQ